MPQFKITMFFSAAKAGWSETYYYLASDMTAAKSQANALQIQRAKILCPPCDGDATRISDETNSKNTFLKDNAGSTRYNFAGAQSDKPWQAQLVKYANTALRFTRHAFIRGIPDDVYDLEDPTNPTAINWLGALDSYLSWVITHGFYIKSRPNRSTAPHIPIVGWVPGLAENATVLTVAGACNLNPNNLINTYKVAGIKPAPGQCLVTAAIPSGSNFTIRLHTPNNFSYAGNAYYIVNVPVYNLIDDYDTEGVTHRDVGRPFGEQRGRRPALRR